jgi:predicted amidophosphoribosyltransferase
VISELAYCSPLVYSPRGTAQASRQSRTYRDALKRADPRFLTTAAAHVARRVNDGLFPGFFGPDVTLVPVPGSAPRKDASTLWVAEQLANALFREGLGGTVWAPLQRRTAVQKSAYADRGGRPNAQTHVESMAVVEFLPPTGRMLLVDDFITKGRTLLASATVLGAAVPGVEIRAFALIRTMGLIPEIERIPDPVVGKVLWNGDAVRQP